MQDHHTDQRQKWISEIPREPEFDIKVAQAKVRMGEKWLFHPANRVKRLPMPLPK